MLDLTGTDPNARAMSCFLLPSSPYLKLAYLPRVVFGYQGYPGTAVSPVSAAPAAAAAPRFAQPAIAVPQQVTNGSFRPAPPGIGTPSPGQTVSGVVHQGYSQISYKVSGANFHRGQFRSGFNKNGRGVKRKADDDSSHDGDASGKTDTSSGNEVLRPLYCEICRVTLNAPSQAKQHYEGKNHNKRMKMYSEGDSTDTSSSGSTTSSTSSSGSDTKTTSTNKSSGTTNGTSSPAPTSTTSTTTHEINPEVYCKICGVSFNSPKQAQQHYHGKNHAKKVRATHSAPNSLTSESATSTKLGSKYNCYACNIHVTSQEQLDSHMKGARHAAKAKVSDRSQRTLKGRWAVTKSSDGTSGFPASVTAISNDASSRPYPFHHPPVRKVWRDFSMYRTPSGRFYCSTCNLTLNSDVQFSQHIDSKKHKASQSARRNSELADS